MSTIVYQSSCTTESYFIEPRTTLSLKLNNNNNNNSSKPSQITTPLNYSSFSSIEALSSTKKHKEENSVYIHPLVKHSNFTLSQRSLEMCTESLGSETGTCDIIQTDDVVFSPSEHKKPRQKSPQNDVVKFPPPLTTMTGSNPIQLKQPYRENGRLVIEAVSSPTVKSCIQAQRTDGRLKLTLFVNNHHYFVDHNDDDEYEEDDSFDSKNNFEVINNKHNFVRKEDVVAEEDKLLEVWNGKKVEFGVKLEMGKLQTTSRCKERGQRLINWEPFWVAT